jgi:hypothetical protein
VLAPHPERLNLIPEQRAVVEILAEDLVAAVDEANLEPADGASEGSSDPLISAAIQADFFFRQRYGHQAWVRLQHQTALQLSGY